MVGRFERKDWGGRYCVVVALQTRLDASLGSSGDCGLEGMSSSLCWYVVWRQILKFEVCSELAAACLGARVATGIGETRGILCALEL